MNQYHVMAKCLIRKYGRIDIRGRNNNDGRFSEMVRLLPVVPPTRSRYLAIANEILTILVIRDEKRRCNVSRYFLSIHKHT